MSAYELAQLNIGVIRAPIDSPLVADFADNLQRINALAEATPGFVWRLQTEAGDATAIRPFEDANTLVNLSVWRDVESLRQYVYASAHAEFMRRRREWFEPMTEAAVVLWWVPRGHRPGLPEAIARLERLRAQGPGAEAFTFGRTFAPPDAPAAAPPSARRPAVWLDLDQAELDAAYDQRVHAANLTQVMGRWVTHSESVRARLGPPCRYDYGPTPVEALDVYTTARRDAPVNIFIHGGGWRGGLARDYGFPAELFVRAGAHYVVPDFTDVTETDGELPPLAAQVRRAVAWVYRNARSFGGDPEPDLCSGHSSGGHLAGVVLVTDWMREFDLPPDIVKGGLCCSGMFDLEPVALSARRNYVRFTAQIEEALSPQRHLARLTAPLILACGTCESPEFQRQSRDFAAAVQAAGEPVRLLVADGYNHFEILETLANPYGVLGRAVLAQMRLGPA